MGGCCRDDCRDVMVGEVGEMPHDYGLPAVGSWLGSCFLELALGLEPPRRPGKETHYDNAMLKHLRWKGTLNGKAI